MRSPASGFTLIEVLVALAIVAIGMAAVLESLTSSANTVAYLKDKTLAQWVGLNQIATTRLGLQPGQVPQTGNTTGDLDYAGRSWHWRQEVTTTQVQGIVRIDVKVRPAEVKGGDDNGWFATVSGIAGDALAPSTGTTPLWDNGTGNNPQCTQPGSLNCTPNGTNSEGLNNPTNPSPSNLGSTGTPSNTGTGNQSNTGNSGTPNPGSTNETPTPPTGGLGSNP